MNSDAFLYQFKDKLAGVPPVMLLGVRGYTLPKDDSIRNRLGLYDDCIFRLIDGKVEAFQASTDPGLYYLEHPMSTLGCAQLALGLWQFNLGLHKGHMALKQAREVTVNRLSPSGKPVALQRGWYGIDIHSGGTNLADVGSWSAGCQILYCPEGGWGATWLKFIDPIVSKLSGNQNTEVPYLLVDSLLALPV